MNNDNIKDQAESLRSQLKPKEFIVTKDSSTKKLKTIAITGGKGGVGKSNFCLNIGIALTQLKEKVCILDADFGLGNLDVLLGERPKFHIGHVFSHIKSFEEITLRGPFGIEWIPAGSGIANLTDIPAEKLGEILAGARNFGRKYDYLLIDTAAGIAREVMVFLKAASEVVVIVTPEPTSMTDAYALIKTLYFEKSNISVHMIVNQCRNEEEGLKVFNKLKDICHQFLGLKVQKLGIVNRDEHLVRAVKKQSPVITMFPYAKISQQFSLIAARIKGLNQEREDLSSFFNDLRGFLS